MQAIFRIGFRFCATNVPENVNFNTEMFLQHMPHRLPGGRAAEDRRDQTAEPLLYDHAKNCENWSIKAGLDLDLDVNQHRVLAFQTSLTD